MHIRGDESFFLMFITKIPMAKFIELKYHVDVDDDEKCERRFQHSLNFDMDYIEFQLFYVIQIVRLTGCQMVGMCVSVCVIEYHSIVEAFYFILHRHYDL